MMPGSWVALYEDDDGHHILYRDGSPFAYVAASGSRGDFAIDARELAGGEFDRWDGEVIILGRTPNAECPRRLGHTVAVWEDGRVWGPRRGR